MMRGVATVLALAVAASSGTACGGNSAVAAAPQTSQESAGRRDPSRDPRSNDPTSAHAAPTTPASAGTSFGGAGNPSSPSTGSTAASAPPATATGTTPEAATTTTSATTEEPKRIGARHVLVQWMGSERAGKAVLRTKDQALVLVQEVLRRAKAGEDVGRLANEYSDEPNAGARGGSLGRFTRGQMVPAFDQVAFKLRVGQVSDIVETPFGYHIIQRTE